MTASNGTSTRRMIYGLLITVAVAMACGRIMAVRELFDPGLFSRPWPADRPNPTPTVGGNDRLRWATIRAVVDDGTYSIGYRDSTPVVPSIVANLAAADTLQECVLATAAYRTRIAGDRGIKTEGGWKAVDMVLDPKSQKFYSSKPPLLPTLVAGEYWLLKKTLGWSIVEDRFNVMRVILLTINALPFLIYLILLSRLCDAFGATDWGRFYVLTAGCFATFMTPFLIALNNHTVATCSVMFALYPVLRTKSPSPLPLSRCGGEGLG